MSHARRARRGRQTPDQGSSQSGSQPPPQRRQPESLFLQPGSSQYSQEEPQSGQAGSSQHSQEEPQAGQAGSSQYSQEQPQSGRTATATQYRQPEPARTASATQYRQPEPARTATATQYRQPEPSRTATATQYRQPEPGRTATATQYRRPEPREREPEPLPKRPLWHYALLGLVGLVVIGGIIALLVVNSGTTRSPRAPRSSSASAVGTSFLTRDGLGHTYQVRLDRIVDPAKAVGTTPASGNRIVGAVYTITGVRGSPVGENVVTNASLLGSNGHIYRATGARVVGYGDFSNSNIAVRPGSHVSGAAAYQIPDGVKVTQAQWASDGGRGPINRWTVP